MQVLWFGGKDSVAHNDVWSSVNQGATFNYVGLAGWSPRSDIAAAAIPGTNCVILLGGNSGSGFLDDSWFTCNSGVTWTNTGVVPFAGGQDYGLVALYDSITTSYF